MRHTKCAVPPLTDNLTIVKVNQVLFPSVLDKWSSQAYYSLCIFNAQLTPGEVLIRGIELSCGCAVNP